MLIDTHCHLNRYDNPNAMVEKARQSGVEIHAVTCSLGEYENIKMAETEGVRPSLGLLPQDILKEAHTLPAWLERATESRFIGEIGLDYVTEDEDERQLQRQTFERILHACADAGDKIITIHSRRAAEDVIDRVTGLPGTVILHWYSGPVERAKTGSETGIYFSFNTAMMSRKGRRLLEVLDPSSVLLETDGPFVEFKNRPAEPPDVRDIINWLAQAWDISVEETARRIEANQAEAFSKPGEP